MKQKIKLILGIIILFIVLLLTKDSLATTVNSIKNQTPIFPQAYGRGILYCKQKGGAVRFTKINPGYTEEVYNVTIPASAWSYVEAELRNTIRARIISTMSELGEEARPIPSSSEQLKWFNGDFVQDNNDIIQSGNLFYGAKTAMTPVWNTTNTIHVENNRTAYIFSAGPEGSPIQAGYEKGNYVETESDKADKNAIQTALWNDPTYNEGNLLTGSPLYKEAYEYEQFYNEKLKNGYNVSLNKDSVQVVVNQKEKTYTVGPYYLTYPDDRRFSYIENMTITTDTGYTGKPEVIFESMKANKLYPSSGEPFFIKFNAEQANYPKKVGINVSFVYLENTKATFERLTGEGDIYQIMGKYNTEYSHHVSDVHPDGVDYGEDYYKITAEVYLMKWGKYPAQVLAYEFVDIDGPDTQKRKWTRKEIKAEENMIDLTMELGGIVWEDSEGGKESIENGILDSTEKRIPNIPVSLYREDGNLVATTRTNANGEYIFKDLNAMYKYIVRFTYNGQYYQPTIYSNASTWGKEGWQTNSNATDIRSQRLEFNAKFASIGSSPENYTGAAGINKTYTREQLLKAGIIDEFGTLISESNASMAQYVRDCMMDAYTGPGDGSYDKYPTPDLFVIDKNPVSREYKKLLKNDPAILYPDAYYINLGLDSREESDLAIKKDIDHVTLEINGQKHTYTYDTLENKENAENEWDISVRLSDAYYNTNYSRELYKEDYIYKASMYGDMSQELGKSKADELEVYVTYKIMVRNQSLSINCKADEIVDYYDQDLEYVPNRSYIQIKNGDNTGIYDAKADGNSRYSANTKTTISGYDNLYVRGLDDKYLTPGQTAYVYLTFKVKKDTIDGEDWVKLDEDIQSGVAIGVGKENIVEINGYSTQYAQGTKVPNVGNVGGTPAGIVDRDSNPGNLNPSDVPKDGKANYAAFEDDTDKAPNIRVILYRDDESVRTISGIVWEDARTKGVKTSTIGNGKNEDSENAINGVTVQLVELMDNGKEFVWRTFEDGSGTASSTTPIINAFNLISNYEFGENHDGKYAFKSFAPGKYVVRFIYGDTVKTVTPSALNMGGLNEKSYNGQDYKSTTYQEGLETQKTYTWREKSTWNNGLENLGKVIREIATYNKTQCNQNETFTYLYDITASEGLTDISDAKDIASIRDSVVNYSDNNVTNYIAEVLASHQTDYEVMNDRNQLLQDLINNTKMTAETGVMVIELEYDRTGTTNQVVDNKTSYKIQNVDLGLEERPKAQLTIDKKVSNVKLTLANGSILFDAKQTADNVLWRKHKTYEADYKNNILDVIRNNGNDKIGLVQLSMDEELMHGATIEISYEITINNVGEVDYKENNFYYTGKINDQNTIVTTRADKVLDYVSNNLQFNANNNSNWKVISNENISSQGLVNSKLKEELENYNTIIVSENLNKDLIPELANKELSFTSVPLVLTQLITSENDTDDLTYSNITEVVATSNDVGRRMAYSVVGNQNPTQEPQEVDSDKAEIVKILPPFGNAGRNVVIATIILAAVGITITGIIFIKKKVLKK